MVPVIRSCQSPTWIWLVNYLHLFIYSSGVHMHTTLDMASKLFTFTFTFTTERTAWQGWPERLGSVMLGVACQQQQRQAWLPCIYMGAGARCVLTLYAAACRGSNCGVPSVYTQMLVSVMIYVFGRNTRTRSLRFCCIGCGRCGERNT